jgi:hypothetical protein
MNPDNYGNNTQRAMDNSNQFSGVSDEQLEDELTRRQLAKAPLFTVEDSSTGQECVFSTAAGSKRITVIANDGGVYWVQGKDLKKLVALIKMAEQ